MQATKARQNEELQQLYDQYRKKKSKIQEQNQEEISKLQEKGKAEVQRQQEYNRASVNHIRTQTSKNLEEIRNQSDQKLTYEKAKYKKALTLQKEAYEAKLKAREDQSQKLSESLKEDLNSHSKKKDHLRTAQRKELLDIQKEYGGRIEEERKEKQNAYNQLRNRGVQNYQVEKERQEKQILELKKSGTDQVMTEHQQHLAEMDQLKKVHQTQVQDIHKKTDKALAEQNLRMTSSLQAQEQELEAQQKELKTEYEKTIKRDREIFEKEKMRNDAIYKKELHQQREEFQDAFQKNQRHHEESFRRAQDQLASAIYNHKLRSLRQNGENLETEDPFYKMRKLDGKLSETESHYILDAPVPENEKDHIKVTVNDGKLVVQGKRSFKDDIRSEGHRVATSSYQSFREELPLGRPVVENFVESKWENGHLRVKIPKA